MHVDEETPQESADAELDELQTDEDALLRRAKRLAQRLSKRVRELLGEDTDEEPVEVRTA